VAPEPGPNLDVLQAENSCSSKDMTCLPVQSVQYTLWEMGKLVLTKVPEVGGPCTSNGFCVRLCCGSCISHLKRFRKIVPRCHIVLSLSCHSPIMTPAWSLQPTG
jgi:hypothetical protein